MGTRHTHTKHAGSAGFSLVEMMIATSIFVLIAVSAISSMLALMDGARTTRGKYITLDSVNLSIESIARLARNGRNFHCGAGDPRQPRDCVYPSSDSQSGGLTFTDQDGRLVCFRVSSLNRLQQSIGTGALCGTYLDVTPPEVVIDYFRAYVSGSTAGDSKQPYMTIVVHGTVAGSGGAVSQFGLQTGVAQRQPDS